MPEQPFQLVSDFTPMGDQPAAIDALAEGIQAGQRYQTLLGATGTGKTFTMAKVIEACQRPALILAPNKTLAAQLYGEFKAFFPDNAVEYFVSYYDYYQPEAYVPRTDTYIEKESSINEQIDRMRHAATRALLEREDVIIVASVSCIYGIGSVETYTAMTFSLKLGQTIERKQLLVVFRAGQPIDFDIHSIPPAASFLSLLSTCLLHQEASHRLGCRPKEVAPAAPMLSFLHIHQPDVSVMHQCCCLNCLPGFLPR